jgi:hypothetical protein
MDAPISSQPITDVSKSTWKYLREHPGTTAAFVLPAVVFGILGILGKSPAIAVVGAFVLIIAFSFLRMKVEQAFMQQFATANGYAFSPTKSMDGLNGAFFRLGNMGSQRAFDAVSGNYGNYPIGLFLYGYVTGSGKSRQSHPYTIFQLQFDTAMPDVVMEHKAFFGESLLQSAAHQKEFISLEGDFNKYFSLSVPKGYETEALEVFTPDVMQVLIEKCKNLSLEIVGTNLFIYSPGYVGTESTLLNFYSIAQYFANQLGPVLSRMKPGLVAEQEVAVGQ